MIVMTLGCKMLLQLSGLHARGKPVGQQRELSSRADQRSLTVRSRKPTMAW
jgi:hypothetical protein